jgi:phosphatidylglycerophosphate synthase
VRVPNLLSLTRLPLAVAFPFAIGRGAAASMAVLALAGLTDVADGWYARRFHQETPIGAVLDGWMDKLFVAAVVVTLVVFRSLSLTDALLLGARELGELPLLLRALLQKRPLQRGYSAAFLGKLATVLQFATVISVILGTAHRSALVLCTSVCGLLAAAYYWAREANGSRSA